jgi:hypothetical protein
MSGKYGAARIPRGPFALVGLMGMLALVAVPEATLGQTVDGAEPPVSFQGRHQIRLSVGFVDITGSASASVGEGAAVTSGIQGSSSLGYRYWVREGWAIAADVGLLSMDQEVSASITSVSVVSSIVGFAVAGVRAQPPSWRLGSRLRPFGEVVVGAFGASTSSVEALPPGVSAEDQTVPGVRFGVGLDLPFGGRFVGGLGGHYVLLPDFDEPIAGRDNFSSWGMEAAFGILLGG